MEEQPHDKVCNMSTAFCPDKVFKQKLGLEANLGTVNHDKAMAGCQDSMLIRVQNLVMAK